MSLTDSARERKNVILSRRQIETLIAQGRKIIIVENKVLKVDGWLKYHPGGDKAIMHMVGRDATDEVNALHSPEARQRMNTFQIGRLEGRWDNFVPPIQGGAFYEVSDVDTTAGRDDSPSSHESSRSASPLFDDNESHLRSARRRKEAPASADQRSSSVSSISSVDEGKEHASKSTYLDTETQKAIDLDRSKYPPLDPVTQDEIVRKYRLLNERIHAEGLYQCSYPSYLIEICRYTLLFALSMAFLRAGWYGTSGLFMGMFWHQLVFTAHDAGHMGITHNFHVDTVIGIIIADFFGGLSIGWWKRNHNVHHIVTNSPEHDPDIEHMPFFAISPRFFSSLTSTYYDRVMAYDVFAKVLVRYQQYLYYPVLTLGRFNLYRLSWEYLLLGQGPKKGPAWWHRWLEIAGNVFFWVWFGYGLVYRSIPTASGRVAFVLVSHMITMPLHVQITLSHFAMSTADLGVQESFPQKMLRTTMDVDCPAWLDFLHGGLQFQAVHHLYPRIPRHNLRRTQKLVQEFCADVGIPYALYGFVDGNKEVLGRLGEVGRQAAILAKCQRSMAERGAVGTALGFHH
ncbi:MAG: hypothetical protein M1838_003933 [Thelocarpon superellum]|nr:MAG: hypothetical protein M1838_003933 [Thelocarpon superellum]